MPFPLAAIPAGISAITGLIDLFGGKKKAKKQEANVQQMLASAPKFNTQTNPVFGSQSAPVQGILNYGMLDMLFNQMAPNAGLDFGESFGDMFSQYITPEVAFSGFGVPQQNFAQGGGFRGMNQMPQPGVNPQQQALNGMIGGSPGGPPQMGGQPMQRQGGFNRDMMMGGGIRGER